jgi:hypothetical protein
MKWICAAAAILFTLGCGSGRKLPEPPGVAASASLTAASSCEELRQSIAAVASQQMRMTIESYRQGAWGWGGVVRGAGGSTAPGVPVPTTSGPAVTSGTNDQVPGVDEGDFTKSDGTRLVVLSGNKLWLSKSWPPQDLSLASSLDIEGWPSELHLDDQARAVVFSTVPDLWTPASQGGGMGGPGVPRGIPIDCAPNLGCFFGPGTTKVTVLDVTDVAAPKVVDEQYLPGRLRSSRRIGGSVRAVLTDDVRWPQGVRFWPDSTGLNSSDQDQWNRALDALEAANDALIHAAPLSDWLPPAEHKLPDGSTVEVGYACTDFYATQAPVRLGLVTVATLDLDAGGPPSRTSILGEASQVYSSADTLYVAEDHWWWWPRPGQQDFTYLHAFDLSDAGRAQYVASGAVEGHPLDSFALDEFDGRLRVAQLLAKRSDDGTPWGRIDLSNRVSVLRRDGNRLLLEGQTPELQPGESLQAARFAGDRGYLVTFRGVDPLITLDLSSAADPRAVGLLRVPGFSTYLQPIDPDHLLALGVELPEPDANGAVDESQRRMKLSLFDVSTLSAPALRAEQLVGTANGWSDASYEHRAFNWFGPRKLLAIPFSDWVPGSASDPWGQFVSDLRVFRVDAAASTIAPLGALDLRDLFESAGSPWFDGWYSAWIRRSVMSTDQAGVDYVYAISDAGLRVSTAGALGQPLATVAFPRPAAP